MRAKLSIVILIFFLGCKKEKNQAVTGRTTSVELQSIEENNRTFIAKKIGDTLDIYNGVTIFYNKSMSNTSGRNLAKDGYNLGLKWQCVEFVKRYYYQHLNHKMPNSYGHAKDFFNTTLTDGTLNKDRDLLQFKNASKSMPEINDLLIFDGNRLNPYGHVAIISKVNKDDIEVVQQNVGRKSRESFPLKFENSKWTIKESSILGWLRMK